MIEDETDVYRTLQKHMDSFPIRFPKRKGGAEIRLLKRLFTPQEAKIATKLEFSPHPSETLNDIYPRVKDLGMSKQELADILEDMADTVYGGIRGELEELDIFVKNIDKDLSDSYRSIKTKYVLITVGILLKNHQN